LYRHKTSRLVAPRFVTPYDAALEGRGDGLVEALLTLYEARLGTPPPEVVGAIRQTQDLAVLRSWLKPIGVGSADDVAAALRAAKSCE
jgi:hypothetical protein